MNKSNKKEINMLLSEHKEFMRFYTILGDDTKNKRYYNKKFKYHKGRFKYWSKVKEDE